MEDSRCWVLSPFLHFLPLLWEDYARLTEWKISVTKSEINRYTYDGGLVTWLCGCCIYNLSFLSRCGNCSEWIWTWIYSLSTHSHFVLDSLPLSNQHFIRGANERKQWRLFKKFKKSKKRSQCIVKRTMIMKPAVFHLSGINFGFVSRCFYISSQIVLNPGSTLRRPCRTRWLLRSYKATMIPGSLTETFQGCVGQVLSSWLQSDEFLWRSPHTSVSWLRAYVFDPWPFPYKLATLEFCCESWGDEGENSRLKYPSSLFVSLNCMIYDSLALQWTISSKRLCDSHQEKKRKFNRQQSALN